jgi:hypothetical protein
MAAGVVIMLHLVNTTRRLRMELSKKPDRIEISDKLAEADRLFDANREYVRNVGRHKNVNQTAEIICRSSWDFIDRRHYVDGDPRTFESYLRGLADGRVITLDEMHPKSKNFFLMLIDAWLASNPRRQVA